MSHQAVNRVAFVCECGIGQVGDRGGSDPTAAAAAMKAGRAWDGKTYLDVIDGEEPVCPNLANHPGQRPQTEVEKLRAELDLLRAKVG